MKLGQPEPLGTIDQDRIRGWNIEAAFDDRGADQYLEPSMIEVLHDPLQITLTHLAMRDLDLTFGYQLRNLLRNAFDILDAVMHEVDLTASF